MSMKESSIRFYLKQNCNCAEAVLLAFSDTLDHNTLKAIGAFGGGMGCKKTCGALCAAVAALGITLIDDKAHGSKVAPASSDFVEKFEKRFGGTDCSVLKPLYFVEGERCTALVGACSDMLEETLKKYS